MLLVAPLGTYALWKRTGDRLVRGLILLFVYEILLFALCLFLSAGLNSSTPIMRDFVGHPFIPMFATAAAILVYAQTLIFPSVVIVTMAIGRRVPASEPVGRRKMSLGVILVAVAVAVLPVAAVVAAHVRWVGPLGGDHIRERALACAAEDIGQALEEHAAAHSGLYPPQGVSWEPGDSMSMAHWFRAYETWGRDSTEMAIGHLPDNPFSGKRYRVGLDFFYFPDSLRKPCDNRRYSTYDGPVQFAGLPAPRGHPGTIVVLGYTPPGPIPRYPTEYAIVLYARDVSEPWHSEKHYREYMVGYGPRREKKVPAPSR